MIKYDHQLLDINFHSYKKHKYSKKIGNVTTKHSDDILTFDIEVSSGFIKNGKVIPYKPGKSNEYWNSLVPVSLCYIWQFSYNDKVYYGRELYTFLQVLNDLPSDINFIIWVHNLSYEFHFLNNILTWESVFARSPHKPMKCVAKEYPNIEFRCTYMLTRLSLHTWGNEIGEYKDSPIDYEKIRTPKTTLTEEELHYCEQDCIVVYKGVQTYLQKYKHLKDIPLTQTGTVRKVIKDMLTSDKRYVKFIKGLVPRHAREYKRLMDIFAGGYTHANKAYSGKVIKGTIEHYDFTSSYPTVMIAEKYPMSRWINVTIEGFPSIKSFEEYAYIFVLEFKNIRCETYNTYIQASKCLGIKIVKDNGRVLEAKDLYITITEQDYLTIKETYTWDEMIVRKIYKSKKAYLPKMFTNYILDLYKNKTELKGVDGKEELYQQSKQYINSMFGMCVTAIIQADIKYDGERWTIEQLTEDMVNDKLNKLRSRRPREHRYFLSYSWGCWITAYARRNLWKCIERCDNDVIYCDTDSIFVKGKKDFSWYNKQITSKLRKACKIQELDFNKTRPKTKRGVEKPLGIFDKEDSCSEFITLGAKRYVERRKSDNKLHLTVSGINKEAVGLLKNKISNFRDGLNFDKDSPYVKKQLSTYLSNMPKVTYPDGYVSRYRYGINLRRNGYLLTISDEYQALIDLFSKSIDGLNDQAYNRLRNKF